MTRLRIVQGRVVFYCQFHLAESAIRFDVMNIFSDVGIAMMRT